MKKSLELSANVSQQLKLTPSVSLSLEILQLSSLDLENFLISELEANPLVEIEDNVSFVLENSKTYYYEEDFDSEFKRPESISEILKEQINLEFDGAEKDVALFIVNNLDRRGLLLVAEEEISEKFNIDIGTVKRIRERVKRLNPVGCGSYSVKELLQVQFEEMGAPTKFIDALSYFEFLPSPSTFKLKTGLSNGDYEEFLSYFRRCDLRPFDSASLNAPVRPEAKVWLEKGEVKLKIFELKKFNFKINNFYLKHAGNKELRKFILEKYQRALSLKRAIEQRKETLERVIKAVFEEQKEFLLDGMSLKPLTLSEISKKVSLHESTVSRCISGKFVETPFGVYPLKFFFPKGSRELTTDRIKEMIREIIENEDKRKPLSDRKISQILEERGFKIARRTVTKYRESLGIPGAFERKIR